MSHSITRRNYLDHLTGLRWNAADNMHVAETADRRYKLKREYDGVWTGTVIYRGMEYTLGTKSGTWEQVCAWLVGQLGLEAA